MTDVPAREYTSADLKQNIAMPRPPRLKPLFTQADIDANPEFDAEDRAAATEKLVKSLKKFGKEPTITVVMGIHDPKGAMATSRYGDEIVKLVTPSPEEKHTIGGTILNLLVMTVHRHCHAECLGGGLARYSRDLHVEGFSPHHYFLMDHPDSEVWNNEQRLMLRWSRAVLENTMTDELWDQGVKTWGVKMCLRYIQFIGYFWTADVRNRTLKVPYPMATDADDHLDKKA